MEEGFRIRMVFFWACVRKGRALAREWDHLPKRSRFNQGPSLVVHLTLVDTRIWAGFCDHRWVGREQRLSRPAFASISRQGAAVERACTAECMRAKFGCSESVRCAYRLACQEDVEAQSAVKEHISEARGGDRGPGVRGPGADLEQR